MENEAALEVDPHAPLTAQMLPVGEGHTLYVETVGNPDGVPALFLHGGPGSGCQPSHRQLFDPARFHAVLFDQRGAGRSTPHGERSANSTDRLIGDIETIRTTLGIDRWLIVGGSWGATLALAYAQTHPDRVTGIVLRATFLGTRRELDWAFSTAMSHFYPRLHADFLGLLKPSECDTPLEAYWRRILDPDPEIHRPAAFAWYQAERILSQIAPPADGLDLSQLPAPGARFPASPFMEAHYFSNGCFLEPDQLLANAAELAGIPGRIVQSRYDLLCPPATSFALAKAWPDANVRIVETAGHGQGQPGVEAAIAEALSELHPIVTSGQ
ncbi:prolyl aminopeptidase [Pelagibacterium halotolerans]|uniref:Proline iminopeptidase n=1 Tax=Pelagibacterium halotolerans (strain DSM 22347 / JCM 15775 / CGMCC 1.7692 / B2) TaxID=1082931 RepID=G4R8A3_PELHB|nr:prolyl aminopeptidase [Pelagibacterium halotolerans]AEQ52347.1 proline iminopeptidase [Pelagibacterium halotolerans B2]QJR17913.1 prolyl aminopeptidase [Pelagibacterium halotolerans]SEA33953.1 prolyl aminopeptidase Serine peptidase. MEROPS family S33 [Pelagibacterium halotolerans]